MHLLLSAKLLVLYSPASGNIFNCPTKWEKMPAGMMLRCNIMEKTHCFALVRITAVASENTEKTKY